MNTTIKEVNDDNKEKLTEEEENHWLEGKTLYRHYLHARFRERPTSLFTTWPSVDNKHLSWCTRDWHTYWKQQLMLAPESLQNRIKSILFYLEFSLQRGN